MTKVHLPSVVPTRVSWNKGRSPGQKRPLLPKRVWAIRVRLERAGNLRDLALFNLAIAESIELLQARGRRRSMPPRGPNWTFTSHR